MFRTSPQKPLFVMAIKRVAIYFLGLDFLVFFYYIVGNYQGFVVDTQLMLLRLVSFLSAAALMAALAGMAAAVALWVRRARRFSVLALVGWAACLAAAGALAFFSSSVQVFSAGS